MVFSITSGCFTTKSIKLRTETMNKKTLQESYNESIEQIMEDYNLNRFKPKRILKYKLMRGDVD